jgi:hypothetical protein
VPLLIRLRGISRSKKARSNYDVRMALRLVKILCCEDSFLQTSDRMRNFLNISGYNALFSVRTDLSDEYRTK